MGYFEGRESIKSFVRKHPALFKLVKIIKGESYKLLLLDYPIKPAPRYGYGKPSHPILLKAIQRNRSEYRKTLKSFLKYKKKLLEIPLSSPEDSLSPCWQNGWLPPLDLIALYSFLCTYKPKRYLEIGSGHSTKLAKRAILDHKLSTRITSIDPEPRESIDKICNTIIRKPLEKTSLRIFNKLEAGDILFIDGSHRCLMNSDVTVVFLDILPRLKAGVIVQFHDIFLPYDYPPGSEERYYNEQYLLATYLLSNESENISIILPNAYISKEERLSKILNPLWKDPKIKDVEGHGASFWIGINKQAQ